MTTNSSTKESLEAGQVTLYHFTNHEALTDIVLDGEIRPSGKSLDREGDEIWPAHNAPDIVWMTTDPAPGWCCEGSGVWKPKPFSVRFTLRLPAGEVDDLQTWAARHKVFPEDAELGPMSDDGRTFRCIERPVMAHTEWVAIDDMHRDGLCAQATWWSKRAEVARARHVQQLATQPAMTPREVEDALVTSGLLRDALRREATRPWGNPGLSKDSQ